MKAKTRPAHPSGRPAPALPKYAPAARPGWPYAFAAAALIVVFWAYSPALHGPFLFDDAVWQLPGFTAPVSLWIRGGVRPVLYFTYWFNAHFWKDDPYTYHFFNLVFHLLSSALIFLIARRLLQISSTQSPVNLLAGFAASLFLLHPVQTEAVAYAAGRSDSLSALLAFTAFTLFLYRKQAAISWTVVAAVLLLFGLALLSKEQAIVLPALLLLTDYWWNPAFSFQGVRANWRLYLPMALGALAGVAFFWRLITTATSAGFALKDFTWYQYFFTQCRALFVYLGMFLLPVNLTLDWDFPISKTILDRGAILGLVALLALVAAAWHYRRRFPLAGYGCFVFLLLMAPTSSFLPIQDPIAERRLYASLLGLLLIVVDILGRLKVARKTLAAACVVVALLASVATRSRAALWGDPLALWQDTVAKSPNKGRPHFHLGMAWFDAGRPDLAIAEYEKTAQLRPLDYNLLVDWGLALDALNRMDEALAKLRQAAAMDSTAHVYTQIAKVYGSRTRWAEALDALATAGTIDPNYPPIYVYRGNVYFNTRQYAPAIAEYQLALKHQPDNLEAMQNLMKARQLLRAAH